MKTALARSYPLLLIVVVFAAGSVARPVARQGQRTVGASGAEPISIDFLAVAKDDARTPILDLTKDNITLKLGGKNRVITNLQLVKMEGPAAPSAAPAPAASPFPAPFATNVRTQASGPGRSVFFIIDTETVRSGEEGAVRNAVDGFLDQLSANDQVALVAVPHGGLSLELTNNLAQARAAIGRMTGAAPATETLVQANDRSRMDIEAVSGILRAMVGSDRPSTIIYIGASLMGPSGAQNLSISSDSSTTGTGGRAGAAGGGDLGSATVQGQGELLPETFNQVRELVGAAHAQIFTVETEGGATISGVSPGATNQGLMSLAGNGGGEFFSHVGLGSEDALARIARETSAYYVATFDADPGDKPNTRYTVSISTSRSDVRIWSRPDFERVKSASTSTKAPSADDMMKTADAFRDLPLRLYAFSTQPTGPDKDKTVWVKAWLEPVSAGVKLTGATAGLYDFTGRRIANYSVPSADLVKAPLQAVLQAPPGKYRLRFAATDGKSSGAVDFPIEVGLVPAGPFKLSGMFPLPPKLLFTSEPEAAGAFELYGGSANQQLSLQTELLGAGPDPKPIEYKINMIADGRYLVVATIPLKDLPPGDYEMRAIVGVEGQPSGTVTVTIRKAK